MKRYRFIGDPETYHDFGFMRNFIYDETFEVANGSTTIAEIVRYRPFDWELIEDGTTSNEFVNEFKFIGDPDDYMRMTGLSKYRIYPGYFKFSLNATRDVKDLALTYPEDWQQLRQSDLLSPEEVKQEVKAQSIVETKPANIKTNPMLACINLM